MPDLSVDQQIETFLATCKTASLATVDAHGNPCAANIQYVHDSHWRLYWVSSATSAHSVNLGAKPEVAMTTYAHQDEPEQIHGLQLLGFASELKGDERATALALYSDKYPFIAEPPFDGLIAQQGMYCFTPTWLRWIDNRQGFGWKFEKSIER